MEIQSIIYKLYIQSIKLRRTNDTFTLTLDLQCCRAKMHGGILKIDEMILKTKYCLVGLDTIDDDYHLVDNADE